MSSPSRKLIPILMLQLGLAFNPVPSLAATVPCAGSAEGAATAFVPGADGVAITVVAQGHASQIGLFTREEQILLDPASGTFTGSIVFTAANGDQLAGTLDGAFVSPGSATGTYAFTGGSGRFAHASGGAEFVLATPDGIHFSVSFAGSLAK